LFSTDSKRIKTSLTNLLENPRNNLSVYQNGVRITDGLLIEILFSERFLKGFSDIVSKIVLQTSLFKKLKFHQENLHLPISNIMSLLNCLEENEVNLKINDIDEILNIYSKPMEPKDDISKVMLYLLGVTLKDISIIIKINTKNDFVDNEYEVIDGTDIQFQIKIIDVDQKFWSNIIKIDQLENVLKDLKYSKICF
jgi:hypothetical protein